MKELYCEKCDEFVDYDIITKEETFNIMDKEEVTIKSKIAVCMRCKNELFNEELEKENQQKAFDIYRKNNKLLYPEEIAKIREKYGLTQKEMSKLLGWGEITYHRYENGCLPDQAHNNQLLLIKDPNNLKKILDNGKHGFTQNKVEKLKQRIKELITKDTKIKELTLSLPGDFYEELMLKSDKMNMDLKEYTRYLLIKNHYEDVVKHAKEKTKYEIATQMLKEFFRNNGLDKWSKIERESNYNHFESFNLRSYIIKAH